MQIQRVDHDSRVHIDIETDDIAAEVARLEKLGAKVVDRLDRWVVMQAPTGQRFCVVRLQRPGFPKNANRWETMASCAHSSCPRPPTRCHRSRRCQGESCGVEGCMNRRDALTLICRTVKV